MSDYSLKTNNDFDGPVADLIKITNAYYKNGKDIKDIINVLRRSDKKAVLKEIMEFEGKSEIQKKLEEEKLRQERSNDFGIGEY